MENAELACLSASLDRARSPEEVFGPLAGNQAEMLAAVRSVYRQMAKTVHPDRYQGTADWDKAGAAFKKLERLWKLARVKIEAGAYGVENPAEMFEPFTVCGKKRLYTVERLLARGDLCDLYLGSFLQAGKSVRGILKVSVKPGDNDLVANEARVLGRLRASDDYEKMRPFVSQLVDAFAYQEAESGIVRQVNVLSYLEGLYSLKEVREVYARGVDPKDMAWMWRRLLVALGFAHASGVIHGAVLPTHILIHPRQHGVVLVDWSYAVLDPAATGEYISAISSSYRDWYPAEVFAREVPTPGLDIAMVARCMIDLLGGDPRKQILLETVPWQLRQYLQGCMLPRPRQRPQDVHLLLDEFDDLIERLWGPRTFREFVMPKS